MKKALFRIGIVALGVAFSILGYLGSPTAFPRVVMVVSILSLVLTICLEIKHYRWRKKNGS